MIKLALNYHLILSATNLKITVIKCSTNCLINAKLSIKLNILITTLRHRAPVVVFISLGWVNIIFLVGLTFSTSSLLLEVFLEFVPNRIFLAGLPVSELELD